MNNLTTSKPQNRILEQDVTDLDQSEYSISHSDCIEILDEMTYIKEVQKETHNGDEIDQSIEEEGKMLGEKKVKCSKAYAIVVEDSVGETSSQVVEIAESNSNIEPEGNSSQQLPITHQHLCCRPFLIKGQRLCPQSRSIQYKHYNMSALNPVLEYTLAKAITAFLNSNGGNIFIGVHETQQFERFVVGSRYSEVDKENIYRKFREIAQTIKPDIIASQLFEIGFIPVVRVKKGVIAPIFGHYVIKISVQQGDPTRLYTVFNPFTGFDEVCFRTETEVLTYKQMHQGLRFLQDRIKMGKRLEKHFPHDNPCSVEKQKGEWKTLLKSIKKAFKKDTRLEVEKNNANKQVFFGKPKKVIVQKDPSPVAGVLAQVLQLNNNASKESVPQISEKDVKNMQNSPKGSTNSQAQRFVSTLSPFLFREMSKDDQQTESINY